MKEFTPVLALPVTLIILLSSLPYTSSETWPFNLPPHERYFPEHEPHIRRDLDIQRRLATTSARGVRKMSDDEGEKFFLDYWQFEDSVPSQSNGGTNSSCTNRTRPPADSFSNSSTYGLLPPVLLHSEKHSSSFLPRIFGRAIFERSFQCPVGTSNCASIDQPDTCCSTGETCISVQDMGNGPVGCCPYGETCGGQVTSCDTAAGYSSCPGSANGGCCIPGYSCQGIGCEFPPQVYHLA